MQIAVTGIDGSGKTTLTRCLVKRLDSKGVKTIVVDVPYFRGYFAGTFMGRWMERVWEIVGSNQSKAVLILATLFGLFIYTILQLKKSDKLLIFEHHPYVDVPLYAETYFGFLGLRLALIARCLWQRPDLVLLMDVSPEVCYRRILQRGFLLQPHETFAKLVLLREAITGYLGRQDLTVLVLDEHKNQELFTLLIKEIKSKKNSTKYGSCQLQRGGHGGQNE